MRIGRPAGDKRTWSSEVVALREVDAVVAQEGQRFAVLDAFWGRRP
jgi:hypothetical protein